MYVGMNLRLCSPAYCSVYDVRNTYENNPNHALLYLYNFNVENTCIIPILNILF